MPVDIHENVLDKFDLKDTNLIDQIMDERSKLTTTEEFDWGLQLIITGLKSYIEKR